MLHLYLELREDRPTIVDIRSSLHHALRNVDPSYAELEDMLGLDPLRVSFLKSGTFQRYTENKLAEGAELAHLKPTHMKPSEEVMDYLLTLGRA